MRRKSTPFARANSDRSDCLNQRSLKRSRILWALDLSEVTRLGEPKCLYGETLAQLGV